jgi:class 3 adenylate cyclase
MDATPRAYSIADSDERIRRILDGAAQYEDLEAIPSTDQLSFGNGFYVQCAAIFIDIRSSSELPRRHQRRTLGKLYRAYVSECVAVLNSSKRCKQVFIQGDCVSAVFDASTKAAINEVFPLTAKLNSMIDLLNFYLQRQGTTPIKCGIGMHCGHALMLKAGFDGSGIDDIVWMGDVLNKASHLCHLAGKGGARAIQISKEVAERVDQESLDVKGRRFIDKTFDGKHQCDVVNVALNDHLKAIRFATGPSGLLEHVDNVLGFRVPPQPTSVPMSMDPDLVLSRR